MDGQVRLRTLDLGPSRLLKNGRKGSGNHSLVPPGLRRASAVPTNHVRSSSGLETHFDYQLQWASVAHVDRHTRCAPLCCDQMKNWLLQSDIGQHEAARLSQQRSRLCRRAPGGPGPSALLFRCSCLTFCSNTGSASLACLQISSAWFDKMLLTNRHISAAVHHGGLCQ